MIFWLEIVILNDLVQVGVALRDEGYQRAALVRPVVITLVQHVRVNALVEEPKFLGPPRLHQQLAEAFYL